MTIVEDLEIKRRSLAMLGASAASGLSREDAIDLSEQLHAAYRRIVELENADKMQLFDGTLRAVVLDDETSHRVDRRGQAHKGTATPSISDVA